MRRENMEKDEIGAKHPNRQAINPIIPSKNGSGGIFWVGTEKGAKRLGFATTGGSKK
jgi:hypothetical protein